MPFKVSFLDKNAANAALKAGVSSKKAASGVLAVVIETPPSDPSFRGEQLRLEQFLNGSHLNQGKMVKNSAQLIGSSQDASGKPVAAYFEPSKSMVKAIRDEGLINFKNSVALNAQITTASGADKGGRSS